jgi:hypothetical protein
LPGIFSSLVYVNIVGLAEGKARAEILAAADGGRMRPSMPPAFPGGVRRASKVKPYPGAGRAPLAAHGRRKPIPTLDTVVTKSCDRDDQQEVFDKTFREGVKLRLGCPQMYIVHGPVRECHSSLVERWRETLIRDYADHLSGRSKSALSFWEQDGWPASGNIATDLCRLIEGLFVRCDAKYHFVPHEYTPEAFRAIVLPLRKQVIVVQHEIDAGRWRPDTPRLIEEYLRFWEAVKGTANIPQFLIFLNVKYPSGRVRHLWKLWEVPRQLRYRRNNRRIVRDLIRVGTPGTGAADSGGETFCFYTPLKELSCVMLQDVVVWFKRHGLGANEVECEMQGRDIFRLNGWRLNERKNMADVEAALEEFIAASAGGVGHVPGTRVYR